MTAKRFGFGAGQGLEALGHRQVEVAAGRRCRCTRRRPCPAPAEVVGGRDVREEVEPLLVAQVGAGLEQRRRLDDERRLAVALLDALDARESRPSRSRGDPPQLVGGRDPGLDRLVEADDPLHQLLGPRRAARARRCRPATILSTDWRIA